MKYIPIRLSARDMARIRKFTKDKKRSARELNRANTLLLLHRGKQETEIADFLGIDFTTVWRTKQKYLSGGLDKALREAPRPGQPVRYTDRHKTTLIAIACSSPPEGRNRWTLSLLQDRFRKEARMRINRETVRLVLKKGGVNLG